MLSIVTFLYVLSFFGDLQGLICGLYETWLNEITRDLEEEFLYVFQSMHDGICIVGLFPCNRYRSEVFLFFLVD